MPALSRVFGLLASFALAPGFASAAHSPSTADAEQAFADELARDNGLDPKAVLDTLATAQFQQSIVDAMTKPAEAKPWKAYRPIFITDKRRNDGVTFWRDNRELIDRAAKEFEVAPEIIVAIIGVETSYGRITGKFRVLDALYTLAFHYPPREKYFRGELKQLFLLQDKHLAYPIDELKGSYAGAMGWGQFMPTSIAKFAVDYDGDGRIDLWNSTPDVVGSVANYFRGYGWEEGGLIATRVQPAENRREIAPGSVEPVYPVEQLVSWGYAPLVHLEPQRPANLVKLDADLGPEFWMTFQNFYVITRYNKSSLYAMAVMQLAESIAAGVAETGP